MLNTFLNKRTISFIMLASVLLAVLFVPGKAAWAAVEANHIAVRSYSNVDWIDRYSGGDSLNVQTSADWVGRHSLVAGSAFADTGPDWVERHASNGYSAPAMIEFKFVPPSR